MQSAIIDLYRRSQIDQNSRLALQIASCFQIALLEARAVGPEALGPGVCEAAARERRPQQLATDLLEPLLAAALAQNHQALLCARILKGQRSSLGK